MVRKYCMRWRNCAFKEILEKHLRDQRYRASYLRAESHKRAPMIFCSLLIQSIPDVFGFVRSGTFGASFWKCSSNQVVHRCLLRVEPSCSSKTTSVGNFFASRIHAQKNANLIVFFFTQVYCDALFVPRNDVWCS